MVCTCSPAMIDELISMLNYTSLVSNSETCLTVRQVSLTGCITAPDWLKTFFAFVKCITSLFHTKLSGKE